MLTQMLRVLKRSRKTPTARALALHVEPRVTAEDRFVLRHLLAQVARPGMVVIEIGSFLGNGSTRTICEFVGQAGGDLYCVDTWRGNDNVAWHQQLAQTHDLFNTFRHHVFSFGGAEVVKPLLMSSAAAARIIADGVADLVFIDGDHAYQGVKQDIQVWRSKVRPGGILCGHDCEGQVSEFGAARIDANLDKDFIQLQGHAFAGFHPGPVKAVEELLGHKAVRWCYKSLRDHGMDERRSSIWHIVVD